MRPLPRIEYEALSGEFWHLNIFLVPYGYGQLVKFVKSMFLNHACIMLTQLFRYLQLLGRWLFKITRNMIKPECYVKVLAGKEKFTKRPLRVLYIGSYRNYSFLISKLFVAEYNQTLSIKKHPFFILVKLKELIGQSDILIVDLDMPYSFLFRHLKAFQIPPWVKQHLRLPSNSDDLLAFLPRKTRKEAQRWVRKFEYTWRITTEIENFERFYKDFYVPFISDRHGDASEVVSLNYFLTEAKGGFLLWLIYKGKPVGAALLKGEGGALRAVWVGFCEKVQDGEVKGASDVLDFFTIQYASEQGYSLVNFGSTRPLANDGVFRYKQKWGAEVALGKIPSGNIVIQPLRNNLAVQSFFSNNLWMIRENKGISILYMVNNERVDSQELSGYTKFVSKGISSLHLFVLEQLEKTELATVLPDGQYKITIISNIKD